MLSQVNYRVPNMRFLRERLTVRALWFICGWGGGGPGPVGLTRPPLCLAQDLEQRSSDITYGQFAQLYRSLMYSAQKTVHESPALPWPWPCSPTPAPAPAPAPALLAPALPPCLGPFGCHFSSCLEASPICCPSLSS